MQRMASKGSAKRDGAGLGWSHRRKGHQHESGRIGREPRGFSRALARPSRRLRSKGIGMSSAASDGNDGRTVRNHGMVRTAIRPQARRSIRQRLKRCPTRRTPECSDMTGSARRERRTRKGSRACPRHRVGTEELQSMEHSPVQRNHSTTAALSVPLIESPFRLLPLSLFHSSNWAALLGRRRGLSGRRPPSTNASPQTTAARSAAPVHKDSLCILSLLSHLILAHHQFVSDFQIVDRIWVTRNPSQTSPKSASL